MISGTAKVWITAGAMLASVFFAGLLTGAAVNEMDGPRRLVRFGSDRDGERGVVIRDGRGPGGPGGSGGGRGGPGRSLAPMLPPEFMEALALTEEQRAALDSVLVRRREQSQAILQEMYPRLRALVDSTNQDIRGLLTAEQQETFERMWESRRGGRTDGPPRTTPPER